MLPMPFPETGLMFPRVNALNAQGNLTRMLRRPFLISPYLVLDPLTTRMSMSCREFDFRHEQARP
jgi:hypothetical protein